MSNYSFAYIFLSAILMVDKWVSETVSPGLNSVLNVGHQYYIGGSPTKNIFSSGLYGYVEMFFSLFQTSSNI